MSYECAECERDLRGGHDPNCSRYVPPRQTDADDLSELGALSADERDQLAADLPSMTIVNATNRRVEFRVTAVPGETGPADIADLADLDPDAIVPGIDATTGLSLHTPIVDPTPSTGKVQFGERLRLWLESLDAEEMRDLPSWAHNDLGAMVRSLELDVAELRERAFLEGIRHTKSVLGVTQDKG